MKKPSIFIIMGVSGCGKSTIGQLLAKEYNIPFFDGDDYHSKENVSKMSAGLPLNDQDRKSWLQTLNTLAKKHIENGAVIACSALKEKYRNQLQNTIENNMVVVYLEGTKKQILTRLEKRKDHFMPVALLNSQFNTLEIPANAITINIDKNPDKIVHLIVNQHKQKKP